MSPSDHRTRPSHVVPSTLLQGCLDALHGGFRTNKARVHARDPREEPEVPRNCREEPVSPGEPRGAAGEVAKTRMGLRSACRGAAQLAASKCTSPGLAGGRGLVSALAAPPLQLVAGLGVFRGQGFGGLVICMRTLQVVRCPKWPRRLQAPAGRACACIALPPLQVVARHWPERPCASRSRFWGSHILRGQVWGPAITISAYAASGAALEQGRPVRCLRKRAPAAALPRLGS